MFKLTKYGNMDVMLHRGAFMPEKTDDPGEVYYIRAPKCSWIYPYDSYTIDTGIYMNLPDGCIGYLRSRTIACVSTIDETKIDGTGNKSILVTIHGDDTVKYICKGDIIAKLEIRPSMHLHIPESNKDITKVNRIEIKRAQSGRQYLVLYVENKDTDFDETVILGDDGYLTKISKDIVESLEQVKRIDTDMFFRNRILRRNQIMRAMKCDRCGKFYDYYEGEKTFEKTGKANGVMFIDMDLDRERWNRKTYDLCPECMKGLEDFLNKKTK